MKVDNVKSQMRKGMLEYCIMLCCTKSLPMLLILFRN